MACICTPPADALAYAPRRPCAERPPDRPPDRAAGQASGRQSPPPKVSRLAPTRLVPTRHTSTRPPAPSSSLAMAPLGMRASSASDAAKMATEVRQKAPPTIEKTDSVLNSAKFGPDPVSIGPNSADSKPNLGGVGPSRSQELAHAGPKSVSSGPKLAVIGRIRLQSGIWPNSPEDQPITARELSKIGRHWSTSGLSLPKFGQRPPQVWPIPSQLDAGRI